MTTKRAVPESAIVRACLHYLALRGICAWRNNSGAAMLPGRGGKMQPVRFGRKGQPDIIGYLDGGKMLCVECKAPGGELTPEQTAWLDRAGAHGCRVIVARSLDDLMRELGDAK